MTTQQTPSLGNYKKVLLASVKELVYTARAIQRVVYNTSFRGSKHSSEKLQRHFLINWQPKPMASTKFSSREALDAKEVKDLQSLLVYMQDE